MKKCIPVFLLALVLLASCAPVYVPNMRNSPMFTKGGEFQGSMQFGNGLDAQAALSITKHIGVIGNYSFADRTSYDADQEDEYHRHKLLEGGLGYFENDGNWCYEIFAGYGKGEGSSYADYEFWGTTSARATGKFERYFIQPAFGFNKKIMHFSFIPRVSVVNFTEFTTDATSIHLDKNAKVFLEPAFMGRINMMDNHLFFVFQAGIAVPASSNIYFEYRNVQLSTGIGFRFGGLKKETAGEPAK
ncbi:hypothetical protein [Chryseolinea lacunae]|uniref:Outer membrane protein beta-barrel domain-containing protein n=1 Tax=Chryseolinea lacunae TaxID=2801331 RepID=A0ABS1KSQ9_9BACT|nr:hypothetical protein [Chryseolinea lacunae]MBL0741727.1 hypothetical protein [Chryseolinea lacunae]